MRDAGGDRGRAGAAQPEQRSDRLDARLRFPGRGAPDVRPDHRRRRACRPGRGAVRRLRGARHPGDRQGGVRGPGKHLGPDRELPGVPDRDLGRRAGRARDPPGSALRCADGGPGYVGRPARRERSLQDRARRRVGGERSNADRGHRSPVPQAAPARARALRGPRRLLRRDPGRGPALRRRSGADRRGRKLGRAGGHVPLPARGRLPPGDPRRRPGQVDVASRWSS